MRCARVLLKNAQPLCHQTGGHDTVDSIPKAVQTFRSVTERHLSWQKAGFFTNATAVTEDNINDKVLETSSLVLLDCWRDGPSQAEGIGQSVSLSLAVSCWQKSNMNQLACVEHLHLNVEENSGIAEHLGVQSTPCVLLVHDAEVVDVIGCAADDLLASHALQQLARGSSKVFENLVYKTTSKVDNLAQGRKYLQQRHWGEARWCFLSVLRAVQAGEFADAQLPDTASTADRMTLAEVIAAKACAGLILVAVSREEHETASALILIAEKMMPRALGYLADARRSICVADIVLLNRCNRHPAIRDACLQFLQGEYLQAFCGLQLVLDDMPFFNDGPPAPEMLLPLLRFVTYLAPSHTVVDEFLHTNPDVASTLQALVEPPYPPCEAFDPSQLDEFLDTC